MPTYQLIATATFGLEAVVRRELEALGLTVLATENGKVTFEGTENDIARTNLWLRSADRVLIKFGEFTATTFDELYEQTRNLHWQTIIPQDGKFDVNGKSVKSTLFSVPDCQRIVKKAIVDKLMFAYKTDLLPETGSDHTVQISLRNDVATLTIDTSGDGLHKRGYRVETVEAPLKETLAAGLVQLSYWSKDRVLYDPFCGSGTIPIEAAMIGRNIAPGLNRDFAAKHWPNVISDATWKQVTKEAYQAIDYARNIDIYASDISHTNLAKAKQNAIEAGVDDCITFHVADFRDLSYHHDYGILISNPPYGERLLESGDIERMTKDMTRTFAHLDTWSLYILTSYKPFEQHFKKADRKRKFYNGRIETWYHQYYGPRPPK